jgi:hypothetical protein
MPIRFDAFSGQLLLNPNYNGPFTPVPQSGNFTPVTGSAYLINTSSSVSVLLPPPTPGFITYIKDSSGLAETNNITLVRNASEQIEGLSSNKILRTNWGGWLVFSNGTDWFLL